MDEIRFSTARIALPERLRNIWPEEFHEIKGEYRLSDGKSMRLSMWGNCMYASIDSMARTQQVAVTPHDFVAVNQTMKVRVDNSGSNVTRAAILLLRRRLAGIDGLDLTRLTASR